MSEEKQNGGSLAAKIGSVFGFLLTAVVCLVGGWVAREMYKPAAVVPEMPPRPPLTVAVTNVEMRAYNFPERFVAHAEAVQEVDLLPQVDGYIKELKFKEGDIVKEGQLLYVLDDERYQAVVNQRKADLAAAEAELARANRYYDRMQKADSRGITQLERDNAEAGALTAQAKVQQEKANLVVAEYDLKKAKVFAPISGQIGKSSAHVGDYVAPSKGSLARIVQIDPIRVSFPLTDRAYIAWREEQKKGENADLRMRLLLADGSEYPGQGTWEFDDNQMSRETATILMRLSFPNPDRLLVPNSYVTLLTDRKVPPQLPCVPQQAVSDLQGGNQGVWVVKDDSTVELRKVTVREAFEGWVPVTEGLKAGERVVISGGLKLATGQKVDLAAPTANDDITAGYVPPIKE